MQLTFTEDGPRSFVYTVEILQDNIAEGPEQLTVQLSAPSGERGVDFHIDSSLLRIIDDDGKDIKCQLLTSSGRIWGTLLVWWCRENALYWPLQASNNCLITIMRLSQQKLVSLGPSY